MIETTNKHNFTEREIDRIIEMAWEDRTTFEAIEYQFKITEAEVIEIMRLQLKPNSFRLWRKRVQGRKTKHQKLRENEVGRFKCSRQRSISNNKVSKR
ncbi:MAG: TIGR03643 family protein [Gillisia sp.]